MDDAIGPDLVDEPVYIRFEPRTFLCKCAVDPEIFHDLGVEHLARDQQPDAGRIGGDKAGGDAPFQFVDWHALRFAPRDMGMGIAGQNSGMQRRNGALLAWWSLNCCRADAR